MASRRNRQVISLLGAMVALLLVGACQPAAAPAPKEAPPKAEEKKPAPPPAVVKQPKYGGTLRVGIRGDPSNLDPHLTTAFTTVTALSLVYSRLLQWNLGSDQDPLELKIIPDFAEKWELEGDRTYVFHLRQGVKWHNKPPVNGREVTSADVKWSFERMKGTATGWVMEPVERIETPDKYTVKFVLKEPTAPFLANVSHSHPRIAPREIADEDKDLKKRAVGFGSYIFEQWERNVRVVLKKNPDYYIKGRPYLDEVIIQIIPEQEVQISALLAGQLDINDTSSEVMTKQAQDLLSKNPKIKGEGVYRPQWYNLFLNSTKAPLNDKRVRQAISKALDRKQLADAIAFGDALWEGPLSVANKQWVYPQEKIREIYKRDLDGAKKLLAEAALAGGFSFEIMSSERDEGAVTDIDQMIAEQLKAVGINVKVAVVEDGVYRTRREPPALNFQSFVGGITAYTDEDQRLSALMQTGGGRNYGGIKDATLDELIVKQRKELDVTKRKQIITQIQDHLIEQMYYVPLISWNSWYLWQDYVQNYRPHFTTMSHSARIYEGVWLDK